MEFQAGELVVVGHGRKGEQLAVTTRATTNGRAPVRKYRAAGARWTTSRIYDWPLRLATDQDVQRLVAAYRRPAFHAEAARLRAEFPPWSTR